jgi:hypothetical protein
VSSFASTVKLFIVTLFVITKIRVIVTKNQSVNFKNYKSVSAKNYLCF